MSAGPSGGAAHWARSRFLSPRAWARTARKDWTHRLDAWAVRRAPDRTVRRFLTLFGIQVLDPGRFLAAPGAGGTDPRPTWRGVPTWKVPLDLWVLQELVTETRPQLIVETGTRFGGTALFLADLLDLTGDGSVVSIDVDQSMVHDAVRAHPRIELIEASSTSPEVVVRLRELAAGRRVMVNLDAAHEADYVRRELEALAPLTSPGCYLVVEDTRQGRTFPPLGGWRGPADALDEWLPRHPEFAVDRARERLGTSHPGGFLRRRPPGTPPRSPG